MSTLAAYDARRLAEQAARHADPEAIVPDAIVIEDEEAQSAGGDYLVYTTVYVAATLGQWEAKRPILMREHWEPSIDRAVNAAADRYGIPPERIFDMRGAR